MNRMSRTRRALVVSMLAAIMGASCDDAPVEQGMPDEREIEAWFGSGTEAEISGNVLLITGTIEADYLRRGGRIWARSGPYFYLFNIHVRQLLLDYPGLAAVRATAVTEDGEELATATLVRSSLNELRWNEAIARASLAQAEGTENPRTIERLIQFGEDHTEYRYGTRAQ